jgi:hypothetical protein
VVGEGGGLDVERSDGGDGGEAGGADAVEEFLRVSVEGAVSAGMEEGGSDWTEDGIASGEREVGI